jgi:hypothetical protein
MNTNQIKLTRLFMGMIFTLLFMIIIEWLEVKFFIPLLSLPSDFCFYHTHKAPLWIDLFYLDGMGHLTTFNGFHILVLFVISLGFATLTTIKIDRWLLKRKQKSS